MLHEMKGKDTQVGTVDNRRKLEMCAVLPC